MTYLPILLALASAPLPGDTLPAWITADPQARTVELRLTVTHPAGSPSALINGHGSGRLQVVVPQGWTVRWHWVNEDSTAAHSLVVQAEREKLPEQGGRPVFTNAMTRAVTAGLAAGRTDVTTFEADQAGWYWVLCGVPAHAIAGEYIGLKVEAGGTGVAVNVK